MALSPSQVYADALAAGFDSATAVIMTAIAGAESAFNPNAHNPKPPDNSYGLWQINMLGAMGPQRRASFGISSNDALYDPMTNARAAKKVYDQQGLRAWSTYTSGSYKAYLGQAQAAANSTDPLVKVGAGLASVLPGGQSLWDAGNSAGQTIAAADPSNLLSGARAIALEVAFLALAAALVTAGLWRATGAGEKLRETGKAVAGAAVPG